jgi:hypothetical protein
MRALVTLAVLACAGHAVAAPKEPATPGSGQPSSLLAAADDLLRQVSALRGLRIKTPVQRGVLSRPEIGECLKARLDKEYTPAEVAAEARVLRRLGLLPADVDYGRLLVDLLMEQVAGFYDPTARRLYIADWLPMELQRPALAHELAHALQDQHFNLGTFIKPIKDDGDRQLARSALVEGDGTALMLELQAQSMRLPLEQLPDLVAQLGEGLLKGGGMADAPELEHAPTFLRETLLFPYFQGLRFVMALRRGKPWKRVDEAWKTPPQSTEHVLHPDRYLAHDDPVKIVARAIAALAPRKEIRRDVLGELGLRILFRSRLSEPQADAAAEGWGGDRLVAYADERPLPVVVDLSIWDTETDAVEATAAFTALFAKITGGKPPADGAARFVDPNGEVWRVERRGKEVLTLFGAPSDDAPVAADAWSALRPTAP